MTNERTLFERLLAAQEKIGKISKDKEKDCISAGGAVLNLIKKDIRPRDILTKKAFENAILFSLFYSHFLPEFSVPQDYSYYFQSLQ